MACIDKRTVAEDTERPSINQPLGPCILLKRPQAEVVSPATTPNVGTLTRKHLDRFLGTTWCLLRPREEDTR